MENKSLRKRNDIFIFLKDILNKESKLQMRWENRIGKKTSRKSWLKFKRFQVIKYLVTLLMWHSMIWRRENDDNNERDRKNDYVST